jgi:hypothetical protein
LQLLEAFGLESPRRLIGIPVPGGEALKLERNRSADERERSAEQHGHGGVFRGKARFGLA